MAGKVRLREHTTPGHFSYEGAATGTKYDIRASTDADGFPGWTITEDGVENPATFSSLFGVRGYIAGKEGK